MRYAREKAADAIRLGRTKDLNRAAYEQELHPRALDRKRGGKLALGLSWALTLHRERHSWP